MKLDKIITLANRQVRLRLLAMERSLRAVGCDLPLWVIPYDNDRFALPANATWWEVPEIVEWLTRRGSPPVMRKYQCLTTGHFQFVDSDVCFLRNPARVLDDHSGFVTSCGHWHNPGHTVTADSARYAKRRTTVWQAGCFNSGQFACDRELYTIAQLRTVAEDPDCVTTCLDFPYHEQPGLNLLVWRSGIGITNLTLPPVNMESTWAGDYPAEYREYWGDAARQPYLIHWAGTRLDVPRPINDIFLNFLTLPERREWDATVESWARRRRQQRWSPRDMLRRVRRGSRSFMAAVKDS